MSTFPPGKESFSTPLTPSPGRWVLIPPDSQDGHGVDPWELGWSETGTLDAYGHFGTFGSKDSAIAALAMVEMTGTGGAFTTAERLASAGFVRHEPTFGIPTSMHTLAAKDGSTVTLSIDTEIRADIGRPNVAARTPIACVPLMGGRPSLLRFGDPSSVALSAVLGAVSNTLERIDIP